MQSPSSAMGLQGDSLGETQGDSPWCSSVNLLMQWGQF